MTGTDGTTAIELPPEGPGSLPETGASCKVEEEFGDNNTDWMVDNEAIGPRVKLLDGGGPNTGLDGDLRVFDEESGGRSRDGEREEDKDEDEGPKAAAERFLTARGTNITDQLLIINRLQQFELWPEMLSVQSSMLHKLSNP